jgi:hypothetical protein
VRRGEKGGLGTGAARGAAEVELKERRRASLAKPESEEVESVSRGESSGGLTSFLGGLV